MKKIPVITYRRSCQYRCPPSPSAEASVRQGSRLLAGSFGTDIADANSKLSGSQLYVTKIRLWGGKRTFHG